MPLTLGAHLPQKFLQASILNSGATKTCNLLQSRQLMLLKWDSDRENQDTRLWKKIPSKSRTVMPCSQSSRWRMIRRLSHQVLAPHTNRRLSLTRFKKMIRVQVPQSDALSLTLQAKMAVKGMWCNKFKAWKRWAISISIMSSIYTPMLLKATLYLMVSKKTRNWPRWAPRSVQLQLWKALQCLLLSRSSSRTWNSSRQVLKSSMTLKRQNSPSWKTKMEVQESYQMDSNKVQGKVPKCIDQQQ